MMESNVDMSDGDGAPVSDAVLHVAHQAEEVRRTGGQRRDTLFYKVVLGGNVQVVKQVVKYMQENDAQETLNWLLMLHDPQANCVGKAIQEMQDYGTCTRADERDRLIASDHGSTCAKGLTCMVLIMLNIIITPLFYAIHILSVAIFNRDQRRISRNIRLPLAFAAFCQDDEMLEYFLCLGNSIRSTDVHGNNIFHYISDLSADTEKRAIEIFDSTMGHFQDDEVRELVVEDRNCAGLTPIEYAAKFGSPTFLTHILKQPNLLQCTEFAVGKRDVRLQGENSSQPLSDIGASVQLADVTMYEAGSISHQSTLLNLLSDRHVSRMTQEDLGLYDRGTFVGEWIGLKVKQMFGGVILFQVIDIVVTALVFVVLLRGANSSPLNVWVHKEHTAVLLKEINLLSVSGRSEVLKDPDAALDRMRLSYQMDFFNLTRASNKTVIGNLFTQLPPGVDTGTIDTISSQLADDATVNEAMDSLSDIALQLDEYEPNWKKLFVWRNMKAIRDQYLTQFLDQNPSFKLSAENKLYNLYDYTDVLSKMDQLWDNFKLTMDNYTFQPSEPVDQLVSLICIDKAFFNDSTDVWYDIKPVPEDVYPYNTSCGLAMLWRLSYDECDYLQGMDLFKKLYIGTRLNNEEIMSSYVSVALLACLYLLLDLLERCVFIISRCSHQRNASSMIMTILGSKVPGSYARKQLNVITFCGILMYVLAYHYIAWFMFEFDTDAEAIQETARYILVIGLVIRFILHIHSMRLLPGIGHFVITTFQMASHLVHFSTILILVIIIFAALFHVLIDDPGCPLEKLDGFNNLPASMFSTFKLTFGHGDMDAYYISTPVMITYSLFIIIVGLLLMNLIIAIMTNAATEIMAAPWRRALWRVAWLDEATAVEYTVSVLGLGCWSCLRGPRLSHSAAGYVVRTGKDGTERVYVSQFVCPALEPDSWTE